MPRGGFDDLGNLTIPAHILFGMVRAAGGVLAWDYHDGLRNEGETITITHYKDPDRYVLKIEEKT
jgi:hypothetical protein